MKNAIILHGMLSRKEYYRDKYPSGSNSHWLPWLQKQLIMRDIAAQTPEIPYAFAPNYAVWRKEFERYDITPETILVGHSCGGGFIVRWLSEHLEARVGKVVLVAPWIDPDRTETTDFFDFILDPNVAKRTTSLTIFNSDNDYESVQKTVQILRDTTKDIHYREFHEYGHFCRKHLGCEEFPELLEEIVG